MTAPTRTLPPPDALDLAVVRARLELRGRKVPGQPRRWWVVFAGATGLVLAAVLVLFLASVALPGQLSPPPAAVAGAAAVLLGVAQLVEARRLRAGDRRIHLRWAQSAARSVGTRTEPQHGRPARAGRAAMVNIALSGLALSLHCVAGTVLLTNKPSATTALALAVPVVAGIGWLTATLTVLRRAPVGDGPVLRAVDDYLVAADLSVVQVAFLLVPSGTVLVAAGLSFDLWVPASYALAVVGMLVLVAVVSDERLVRDPRLSEAPAAQAWLDGAAA